MLLEGNDFGHYSWPSRTRGEKQSNKRLRNRECRTEGGVWPCSSIFVCLKISKTLSKFIAESSGPSMAILMSRPRFWSVILLRTRVL